MKLFKKLALTIALVAGMAIGAQAQSGWQSGRYYAYKGGSDVVCGPVQTVYKSNGYVNWTEGWKTCKKRNWYQEYRSGYVWYWGPNGWYQKFQEGYFWYFTWYTYNVRVW